VAADVIPGERADQNHKQQNFGLNWVHLFSARSIGEFRYGLGLRTTLVNIAAGNDTPIIRFFNPSPITTQSSIGSAGNFPIHRFQTEQTFAGNNSTISLTISRVASTAAPSQRVTVSTTVTGSLSSSTVAHRIIKRATVLSSSRTGLTKQTSTAKTIGVSAAT
jgi:hypothetical protein